MRETRSSGSVEGVVGNHDSYSDFGFSLPDFAKLKIGFGESLSAQNSRSASNFRQRREGVNALGVMRLLSLGRELTRWLENGCNQMYP